MIFFLRIRRPRRSTLSSSSAASDVYKRQDDINGINGSHNQDDHDDRSVAHSTSPSRVSKSPPRMTSNLDTMMNPTTSLLETSKTNSTLEEYHKTSLSGAARNATDVQTGEIPF
eukprot:TRINITY_DN57664_c0_g1_i1.p1 TRINITY_DN57664_c0_g1~~TRINITY_DN57664_c0_g1_i1.p1  ORF type:complete len:114 (+),score=24.10 TRINITY_DN57664_c0_g1_i1:109-450(+)